MAMNTVKDRGREVVACEGEWCDVEWCDVPANLTRHVLQEQGAFQTYLQLVVGAELEVFSKVGSAQWTLGVPPLDLDEAVKAAIMP